MVVLVFLVVVTGMVACLSVPLRSRSRCSSPPFFSLVPLPSLSSEASVVGPTIKEKISSDAWDSLIEDPDAEVSTRTQPPHSMHLRREQRNANRAAATLLGQHRDVGHFLRPRGRAEGAACVLVTCVRARLLLFVLVLAVLLILAKGATFFEWQALRKHHYFSYL